MTGRCMSCGTKTSQRSLQKIIWDLCYICFNKSHWFLTPLTSIHEMKKDSRLILNCGGCDEELSHRSKSVWSLCYGCFNASAWFLAPLLGVRWLKMELK